MMSGHIILALIKIGRLVAGILAVLVGRALGVAARRGGPR